jgi:hypothetical protein
MHQHIQLASTQRLYESKSRDCMSRNDIWTPPNIALYILRNCWDVHLTKVLSIHPPWVNDSDMVDPYCPYIVLTMPTETLQSVWRRCCLQLTRIFVTGDHELWELLLSFLARMWLRPSALASGAIQRRRRNRKDHQAV